MIANQVTINPEREARYLFSKPYTYSHGVIVTAADNNDIKTLDGPRGQDHRAVGDQQLGRRSPATPAPRCSRSRASPRPPSCSSQGRVDAIVNDNIAVLDYLASTGSKRHQDRRRRRRRGQPAGADLPQVRRRAARPGGQGAGGARGRRHPARRSRRSTSRPTSRVPDPGERRSSRGPTRDAARRGGQGRRLADAARASSRAPSRSPRSASLSGW